MLNPTQACFFRGMALLTLLAGAGVVAAAPGANKPDPTKKSAVAGQLPEGSKLTAEQLALHIDRLIEQKTTAEKVALSPCTDDAEFLRRVSLDLTGKVPPADKAVAFLDSKESNKRAKLIDELLASKDHGRHLANVWQALLLTRRVDNRRFLQYYPHVEKWLAEQFNAGVSWDKIVRGVVTATGPVDKDGPAAYYLANATADTMTDNVARMFLGVQLQCAQCHNHPFTDWKQNEYWQMATFFTKVGAAGNPKKAAKSGDAIVISENPKGRGRKKANPSMKVLPPKFLGGEQPTVKANEPVRPILADWMTSPKNPYFARAMVNRTWGQLLGRGFINPVDDMHDGQVNSHPALLADLAGQFAASGFDVKYLLRAICNSQTYQRSSKPSGNNGDFGPEFFARMAIKPLTPAQMFDSLALVMGPSAPEKGGKKGKGKKYGGSPREAFVTFFGIEDGADPTEYQAGIPQVLRLMNSAQFNKAPFLASLARSGKSKAEITEKLYLTVLARRPSGEETERVAAYLTKNGNDRDAYGGVLWALMNSSEFALNR